jgi:hypothetical protein
MMHARKMLVILPEAIEELKAKTQNDVGMNALDNEMHNILKRRNLDDQDNWTLFGQVLQKYMIGAQ